MTDQPTVWEQQWRERVEAWRLSGQTQREFCRSQGISESKLSCWKKELKRREAVRRGVCADEALAASTGSAGEGLQWIPVSWPSSPAGRPSEPALSAEAQLELVLARGWVIRLGRQFDGESLRRLLGVLEGCPC